MNQAGSEDGLSLPAWLIFRLPPSAYLFGNVNAYILMLSPCPLTNTMYCLPLCMYVIGTALVGLGITTDPTSFPEVLSNA